MPLISVNGDKAARILQGTLNIRLTPIVAGFGGRGPEFKESSVLENGIIHRVSVDQPGIYKLDYNYIKDKLKIDPSAIDPTRIGIYSNGGGRVPQWNAAPRIDDLEQSATLGNGLDDGQFNQGDYLLWFAQGPHSWAFDPAERIYNMELNNYDEVNHYYIIINGQERKAIESRPNGTGGDYLAEQSMDYQRMEDEKVNLLGAVQTTWFRPGMVWRRNGGRQGIELY
jgi:hypothetical protein